MPIDQRRPTMTAARYVGPQAASPATTGGAAHPLDDETDQRDWYEHTLSAAGAPVFRGRVR